MVADYKPIVSKEIEFWEWEYLKQIVYLLNLDKEKMLDGFQTKELIKDDWKDYLGKETSEFAVGAERIFYWLFNQFGQPNSSPIGSDLFFETYNAYIHIDIKTVTLANVGDYRNIFVGNNQVSYKCNISTKAGRTEEYIPHLPTIYNKKNIDGTSEQKVCLTYFITILYDERTLEIADLSVISVPNGELVDTYGELVDTYGEIYNAGKNPGKARVNCDRISSYLLLGEDKKRIIHIVRKDFEELNHPKLTKKKYENAIKL